MVRDGLTTTIDIFDAACLVSRIVPKLAFLPQTHIAAVETYIGTLAPPATNPPQIFHTSILALQSTIQAMLAALLRPPTLVSRINLAGEAIKRNYNSVSRSTRWPLGLLDDTRQRINEEKEERARRGQIELEELSKELRYTQQTVASELAGWQDMHERMGRQAIKEFARNMLIIERERLQGIRRALRKLQGDPPELVLAAEAEQPDAVESDIFGTVNSSVSNGGESSAMGEAAVNGVR